MIVNEGYRYRVARQMMLWANGRPEHNRTDDECCPDFSCCHPDLYTADDEERRRVYAALMRRYAAERGDPPPAPRRQRSTAVLVRPKR